MPTIDDLYNQLSGSLVNRGLLDEFPSPSEFEDRGLLPSTPIDQQGFLPSQQTQQGFNSQNVSSMLQSLRGANLTSLSSTDRNIYFNQFLQQEDQAEPGDFFGQVDENWFVENERFITRKVKDLVKLFEGAEKGEVSQDILGSSVTNIMDDLVRDITTAKQAEKPQIGEAGTIEDTQGKSSQVFEQALQGSGRQITPAVIEGRDVDIIGDTGFYTYKDEKGDFVFKQIRPRLGLPEPEAPAPEFRQAITPKEIPLPRTAESFRREMGYMSPEEQRRRFGQQVTFHKFTPEEHAQMAQEDYLKAVQEQRGRQAIGRERRAEAGERRAQAGEKRAQAAATRAAQPKSIQAALLKAKSPEETQRLLKLQQLFSQAQRKPEDLTSRIFKFQKLQLEGRKADLNQKNYELEVRKLDLANKKLEQTLGKAKKGMKLTRSDIRNYGKNVEKSVLIQDPDNEKFSIPDNNAAWLQFSGLAVLLKTVEEREALFKEFVSRFGGEPEYYLLREHINELVETGTPE